MKFSPFVNKDVSQSWFNEIIYSKPMNNWSFKTCIEVGEWRRVVSERRLKKERDGKIFFKNYFYLIHNFIVCAHTWVQSIALCSINYIVVPGQHKDTILSCCPNLCWGKFNKTYFMEKTLKSNLFALLLWWQFCTSS